METWALSGEILFPDGRFRSGHLVISGSIIAQIAPGPAPAGQQVREVAGWILPGFVDLQVNGGFGVDVTSQPSRLPDLARALPRTGVTAFLPTVITSPIGKYPQILPALTRASTEAEGAQPLGVHLEGPYLSPQRPGAHNPALLRHPNLSEIESLVGLADVRLFTLAPELPGAEECIRWLRAQGVVVSAGHSAASYEEAQAGIAAGIGYGTHLFNAMSPFDHRQPGLVGALLDAPIPIGLIVDGVHLHPATIRLVWRVKGAEGLTLITDAVAAMGMPGGEHLLGDRRVIVEGGADALLVTPGIARRVYKVLKGTGTSLMLRVDGTATSIGPDLTNDELICSVECALRMGADGVATFGVIGVPREAQLAKKNGYVAEQCELWGMPMMTEMIPPEMPVSYTHLTLPTKA